MCIDEMEVHVMPFFLHCPRFFTNLVVSALVFVLLLPHRCMLADSEGREILRARPVINEVTVDLNALAVSNMSSSWA